MINAILKEIELQKDYLQEKTLSSIYLGGGTPSLLTQKDLDLIFNQIHTYYSIAETAEITLEANPDDLTPTKIKELAQSPVNRLSIGIQSFSDADLKYMNRAHNAQEASHCIQLVQDAGFDNLTVDLIYGTPTLSQQQWEDNINHVLQHDIPHISCYCLTVEPKTALNHFIKTGKQQPPNEEQAAIQFEYLIQRMEAAAYHHYEISNFAKPNCYAVHNSNYWLGSQYLGIGPSAHTFNGDSRQWNIANNMHYIKAIESGIVPFEKEQLSKTEQYNEYVMTSLRTIWGCKLEKIAHFGYLFQEHFVKNVQSFLHDKLVIEQQATFTLTKKGKLLADDITMNLFV